MYVLRFLYVPLYIINRSKETKGEESCTHKYKQIL